MWVANYFLELHQIILCNDKWSMSPFITVILPCSCYHSHNQYHAFHFQLNGQITMKNLSIWLSSRYFSKWSELAHLILEVWVVSNWFMQRKYQRQNWTLTTIIPTWLIMLLAFLRWEHESVPLANYISMR